MNKVTIQYGDSIVEYECSYALARAVSTIMNHMKIYKSEEKNRLYLDELVNEEEKDGIQN